jgi:hypothetical protein
MPTYILLSSLTPEGSQTLHKDPERLDAVNKEIAEFGCKVVTQYAVLSAGTILLRLSTPRITKRSRIYPSIYHLGAR